MIATIMTIEDDNEPKDLSRQTCNGFLINLFAMDSMTQIIWPLFQRAQLYDQEILVVEIDFGVHQIDAMT
jgi:hypothetical protein